MTLNANAAQASDDARRHRLERMESLVTMASGIAHDINNYIAAIMGNNAVMQRCVELNERARECGQRIDASSNLALQLTEQLAIYSGRVECNPVSVAVAPLLEHVRAATAAAVPRGVVMDIERHSECANILADPAQLPRLLIGLVTNAAEAMVDRHGLIHVSVHYAKLEPRDSDLAFFPLVMDGAWVEIAVRDGGGGISPSVRERMFNPFFSTKIRGRGMGLPEALGIVRMHNGNILVKSQPGTGTTVRVLLPAAGNPALRTE